MEQVIENQNQIGFHRKSRHHPLFFFLEQFFWKLQQDLELILELKQ